MSTMKVDSIVSSGGTNTAQINGALAVNTTSLRTELNATGSAPIYACRAWVNFNGTGTVAIRASGNVSSVTDNGVGNYTVNFATAMPNTNYAAVMSTSMDLVGAALVSEESSAATRTSSSITVVVVSISPIAAVDRSLVSVAIFR